MSYDGMSPDFMTPQFDEEIETLAADMQDASKTIGMVITLAEKLFISSSVLQSEHDYEVELSAERCLNIARMFYSVVNARIVLPEFWEPRQHPGEAPGFKSDNQSASSDEEPTPVGVEVKTE